MIIDIKKAIIFIDQIQNIYIVKNDKNYNLQYMHKNIDLIKFIKRTLKIEIKNKSITLKTIKNILKKIIKKDLLNVYIIIKLKGITENIEFNYKTDYAHFL